MNNKGFTLIELLAVIVVLAIVMVLATTTVLPLMTTARENAFRIEATDVLNAAEAAKDLYYLGELKFGTTSAEKQSKCMNTTKMCFTVDSLIDLSIYKTEKGTFTGKVEIDITDPKKPVFTLYFQKGDEFRFVGLKYNSYKDDGTINNDTWKAAYNTCSC